MTDGPLPEEACTQAGILVPAMGDAEEDATCERNYPGC